MDLSVLSTLVGLPLHVHAEGLRGTGKTTIMRSVRRRLPLIQRVKGCVFNCLPWAPHCPRHRDLRPDEVRAVGLEWIPMPFREISHSAKVGTVAGSLDLGRITDRDHPEAAMLPGTLSQANRGIIFIDEINRLADTAPELADILLDVMGTKPGRLQVEETGLPCVDLPITVSVWAASNPDEDPGPLEDIRKQLSDRFDFVIAMERPMAVATVRDILRSSRDGLLSRAVSPELSVELGGPALEGLVSTAKGAAANAVEEAAANAVEEAAANAGGSAGGSDLSVWAESVERVRRVECPESVEELVASLYVDFGLESLRGVEAIHHGARMNCVLEDRATVTFSDVAAVAPGALQHRLDISTFARVMDHLGQKARAESPHEAAGAVGSEPGEAGGGAVPPSPDSLQPSVTAFDGQLPAPPSSAISGSGPTTSGSGSAKESQRLEGRGRSAGAGRSFWSFFGWPGTRGPERGFGVTGSGRADGATRPGRSGQGGFGLPGRRGDADGTSDAPPVAPLRPARPLAEILRKLELGATDPPGPRAP
jgi:magnesium chelatase subunit I